MIKLRWWTPDIFRLNIVLPLIVIHVETFMYYMPEDAYILFAFKLGFWKWRTEFTLGKNRRP